MRGQLVSVVEEWASSIHECFFIIFPFGRRTEIGYFVGHLCFVAYVIVK